MSIVLLLGGPFLSLDNTIHVLQAFWFLPNPVPLNLDPWICAKRPESKIYRPIIADSYR